MRIAYDLRYAADHFTGIGTHAWHLFESLVAAPGDHRLVTLWNPRLEARRYEIPRHRSHSRVEWHERPIDPIHPRGLLPLARWLREVRADVYFSPFYLRPLGAPCPSLLTIHDVWPLRGGELTPIRALIYRMSLALAGGAAGIVTSSDFSREEIVTLLGVPPARVHVVRPGVPSRPAATPRRPAAAPDGDFALVVGDNRPRKNLDVLARAWAKLGDPPLSLVAAGPMISRFPSMDALAREACARGVVTLGWLGSEELEWLYRNARMVLFPTRYEGFGFPLVEAFDRGLPAIASDIPPLREIGEGAARFVPAGDAEAWAAAIRETLDDPAGRERRVATGKERLAALSYERAANAVLELAKSAAFSRRERVS